MKFYPNIDTANVVEQRAGDELLLYKQTNNKFFCLNQTSGKIYDLCDGKNDITDIAEKTNLPENLVRLAVDELSRQDLLKEKIEINASRRELLRGIASASILLPVITSLVAPVVAHASSTCGTIPSNGFFTIPNNGGGTSSCFTAANDAVCQSCRVNAASCVNPDCSSIRCTCR